MVGRTLPSFKTTHNNSLQRNSGVRRLCSVVLLLVLRTVTADAAELADLEARHLASISSEEGKAFEVLALRAFWGDISFMHRDCAPPDAPLPSPFEIYYELNADGTMKAIHFFPETEVGRCIRRHVINNVFPEPPSKDWVGAIGMAFTQ